MDCSICGENFKSKKSQRNHQIEEHNYLETGPNIDGDIQCYKCGENFPNLKDIRDHQREKHNYFQSITIGEPRPFQCHVCKATFKTEKSLGLHICRVFNIREKGQPIKCHLCEATFPRLDEYRLHMGTFHMKEKKFQCDQCDFKGKTSFHVSKHVDRVHRKVGQDVCHICGKTFASAVNLKYHLETIHSSGDKKFVCDKCGASYTCLRTLKGHVKSKHPVYYMCTFCEKLMTTPFKLKLHLFEGHKVKEGIKTLYVCSICQKQCSSCKDLDEHQKIEHNQPTNGEGQTCKICDDFVTSYSSRITLKIHILETHEVNFGQGIEDPYICELFDITPSQEHKELMAYGVECQQCHKMFATDRRLFEHRKSVHEKSSHVKCDYCDFTAWQPHLVKRHMEGKHIRSTKYECDKCKFVAYEKKSFRLHQRRVHEKDLGKYKCSECGKGFTIRTNYMQHLLRSHDIVYQGP
jgi:hypothetical protein